MPDTYLQEMRDGVLEVTLHRPHRLNATNAQAREELAALWRTVRSDRRVRCVILTGTGRAFCAGADADDMSTGLRPPGDIGYIAAVDFCPGEWVDVPIIVAVNGLCTGAGLNFLADADLVVAAEDSWFSDPHVSVGQVSAIEPLLLAPKIPYAVIAKLVLMGSSYRMTASEALAAGLVHEVLPEPEVMPRCRTIAESIVAQSPTALRESLRVLRRYARSLVSDQLDDAWTVAYSHFSHPDATEGPLAFMERRRPTWTDSDPE